MNMNDNSKTNTGKPVKGRELYKDVRVKELLAKAEIQDALAKNIEVPNPVIVKIVQKPYQNKDTQITTQKIEAVSGTSLMDSVTVNFTLVGQTLDTVDAINKIYRIIDYTLGLEANMSGGKFGGYAAKGLKLLVTRMEEVEGD